MKTKNHPAIWNNPINFFGRGLALLGLFVLCGTSHAAVIVKADNAIVLNQGASWTNGVPPGSGDDAQWDGTVSTGYAVEIGGNTDWAGIIMLNPGGAATLGMNGVAITAASGSPTLTYTAAPANALTNNDRVVLGGTTVPGGFTAGTLYFVVNATATTFQLSATSGGAAISATSTGTAVTVTGGSTLTLGADGINTSGGSQTLTIPGPVVSGAAQNWNIVSGVTLLGGLSGANASGDSVTDIGSGTLTINGQGMTLSNLVVDSGATVSLGAGGLGIVALNGGTVDINAAVNEGINVMANGGTEQNIGGNRTWSGILTGSGPLTVIPSSTHTWSGNNTNYTGTITINLNGTGTLRLSSVNAVGASTTYILNGIMTANAAGIFNLGSLSGSGTLNTVANENFSIGALGGNTDFSGVIGGAGQIFKTGTGTLTLDGASTYSGGTIISNGVLQVGSGGSSGRLGVGNVTNYTTLSLNRSDASFSFTNVITGTGTVRQDGSGTTILSGPAGGNGNNNYSGGTILNNGILNFTTGALGTGGVAFTNNATLQWAAGNTTDISAQTVTIGSGGGTMDVNGNTVVLANPIGNGGSGVLTVKSTIANGVLNLQGANTYAGGTTISSGTLNANNIGGSATGSGNVAVSGGGALGGTGTITGAVDVQGNGILAPGNNSVGTLTVGILTLESGSTNNFEFNATPANDKVVVSTSGGLTINGGMFNLYTAGGTTPWTTVGTYNLIQYSGSAPSLDSSWTTTSSSNPHVANPQTGYQYSFTASGGFLKVTITGSSTSVLGTWDVNADGNWSDATKWSSNPKVPHAAGDSATFGTGTALRTVTLDTNESVGAITMNNNNSFVIANSGKALTLDNSGSGASVNVSAGAANGIQTAVALNDNATLSVSANNSLAISGVVSNTSAAKKLTVSGAGVLSLSGNNTYGPAPSSGFGTTLSGSGTLQVGNNNALGVGDVSISASGTLQAGAAGLSVANNFDIASGVTATFDNNGKNLTLGGVISDNGALTKIGNGTLTLNGNNTYSGNTTVNAGVLSISSSANVQNTPTIILNGGDLLGNGTFGANNNISIGLASGTVGTNALVDAASGQAFTLGGVIASTGNSGANNLVVNSGAGNGTLILSGANTFNGTTVVSNGTLQVANTLALQDSTLNYSSGNVVFDPGINAATFGGLAGTNNLALTNLNGGIIALTVGNNNASTTYAGGLYDGGVGGSLNIGGTGTLSLTGKNTYSGTTTANTGTLEVNGGSLVASNTMTFNGGTLLLTNSGSITVPALDVGTGASGSSPGTVIVDSGTASFGTTRISSGTINGGTIAINGGTVSFSTLTDRRDASSGAASLNEGIIINGGATTVSNLFISTGNSGADLTVSNGSLTIGNSTVTGGFIIGSGTSTARGGFLTVAGGTLTYLGTDGLLLNDAATSQSTASFGGGVSTFTGITMNNPAVLTGGNSVLGISGGTVYLGGIGLVANTQAGGATASITLTSGILGATANWSSAAPMTLAGNVTIQSADASANAWNIELDGVLSGAGGLTKTGNGTLMLSGANIYTGDTTVNAGTLELAQPSLFTNSTVSVASGATLKLDFATTNIVTGLVLNGTRKPLGVYNHTTDPTFLAGTGSIKVGINPNPPFMAFSVSSGILTLSWPTNAGWTLQQQTNSLSIGLSTNWVDVPGSTSITSTNITMDPTKPTVFYRLKL